VVKGRWKIRRKRKENKRARKEIEREIYQKETGIRKLRREIREGR
jgi:hypothetical protein